MKKVLFSLLSASALLCSTSCSDEAVVSPEVGGEAMVNFTVQLNDGNASRAAISDGKKATDLYYEVYALNSAGKYELTSLDNWKEGAAADPVKIQDSEFKLSLNLVKNQKYKVVFWAQTPGAYNAQDLTAIDVYKDATGKDAKVTNDEYRDAFTYVYTIDNVQGAQKHTVTLTRPFAQINFAAPLKDLEDAEAAGATLTESQIKVTNAAETFNAFDQEGVYEGEEAKTIEFVMADMPNRVEDLTIGTTTYKYLATAYVLYPGGVADKTTSDLTLTVLTGLNTPVVLEVPAAPAQRNYRTNVIGNLLTNQTDFTVIVNPIYAGEETVNIWDGKSVAKPEKNEDNDYIITSAEELAWVANLVNGTLPAEARALAPAESLAGVTVKLANDINLANQAWTPIGNASNPFKGTFDGNGKTIHNLNVQMAGDSNAGLFGVTHDGEIKNFTVENAKVSGRLNVGVVAGQPYTSKYTGITVTGHVEVNGMAYVGGVGGKNAYADWTNVTVNADETSYVKANSVENGTAYRTYVGGVVGFNGEGTHTFKNITSNIDVKGSTCDVGGLFGIAHYGNKFETCVCTGNVEITNAAEADEAQEIGGIAGVWHNGGENVVLTGCSFTGSLTTNIEVKYYYGGLVGKPYSATGNGKLIINGDVVVANAAQLQAALDAATGESTIKFGANIEGDVVVSQKDGVKITIDGANLKYDGQIAVHGNSDFNTNPELKITNVNFETATADKVFVWSYDSNAPVRYAHKVTIENCTFTATGEAVNTAVGAKVLQAKDINIVGCVANDMHSLLQAQSCDGAIKVERCTINGKNGISFGNTAYPTLKESTITAVGYGVRADGDANRGNLEVNDATINAKQPIIIRKVTTDGYTVALDEATLKTSEAYHVVFTSGSDDAEYVAPTCAWDITGADAYKVFGFTEVASWSEFTAALGANATKIKLTDDITYDANYQLLKDVTIDLNGKSMTLPMINIHKNVTIKNGNIIGKMYARTGCKATLEGLTFSGTISDDLSTEGHLQVQGSCDVYAKNCTFAATTVNGSQTRSLSIEGSSSGIRKFEGCDFKFVSWGNGAGKYKKNVYINPMNGTTTVDFTDCKLNGKAPNIIFAAAYPLTNLTMSGCDNTAPTLEINRAKDTVTEVEWAHISSLIANNKFTQVRVFYAGGSSEYIR